MTASPPATVIASMSRVDRAAGRSVREADRKRRATARRRPSRSEVEAHQALITRLTQAHKVAPKRVDWDHILAEGPVAPAIARDALSAAARRKLAEYRPSLMDSLLGVEREKRRELTEKVLEAAKADAELWARAKVEADVHNRLLALAPDIRALKVEAIAGALKVQGAPKVFKDILEAFTIHQPTPERIVARIDLLEFDALPDEACLSGATSAAWIAMSAADRAELQLANACSMALRAAVEVLQVVRIDAVEVVARVCRPGGLTEADMRPVLHMKLPAAVLAGLQLRKLDAAPTVAALGARMAWAPERGLSPIDIDSLGLGGLNPPSTQAA